LLFFEKWTGGQKLLPLDVQFGALRPFSGQLFFPLPHFFSRWHGFLIAAFILKKNWPPKQTPQPANPGKPGNSLPLAVGRCRPTFALHLKIKS
jgi:hypothetical protein